MAFNSTLSAGNIRRLALLKTQRPYFSLNKPKEIKVVLTIRTSIMILFASRFSSMLGGLSRVNFQPLIRNFWKQWVFRSQQAQAACHCFVSLEFLHRKRLERQPYLFICKQANGTNCFHSSMSAKKMCFGDWVPMMFWHWELATWFNPTRNQVMFSCICDLIKFENIESKRFVDSLSIY